MKIAYVGDLHLIDHKSAPAKMAARRRKFIESVPDVIGTIEWLNSRKPNYVFFTGDIIDWYSEGNVELAYSILSRLEVPWAMTPGNHDVSGDPGLTRCECFAAASEAFAARNIEFGNRVFDFSEIRVLLIDSYASRVSADCVSFVRENYAVGKRTVIVTHVPLEVTVTGEKILEVDPHRNIYKYTLAGSPDFFETAIKGNINDVYTGHLHFSLDFDIVGTGFHILSLGFSGHHGDFHSGVRLVEY